ncbi:lipid-A-disaccharide synthase [Alienimonas californiensis]|uniref:Lipid-A-disaccharide synthase n=1 Tax=Alienimonas californiensis TaxID=2527989 RepID=A0A517P7C8_9PLAN|nr:lipid-A-disaccharide synthase [Alienimonas californiensis]QDT15272.1 Glycosyl transferase [Alienimonas californiensis]
MHLFLSAGEPSGDQHAAHLLTELRRRDPALKAVGYGGPDLAAAGQEQHFRLTDLAVMGVTAVLPHLKQFFALRDRAAAYFREQRPDALLLVDFPGFHWHLAKAAKKAGVPVIYYLPPQMWAWAPWRVRKIRKHVDHLLCALPFEPQWFADRGVSAETGIPCEDVGHPFFDEAAEKRLDQAFLNERRGARTVGVLPGSRDREVESNGPILAAAVRQLAALHPDVTFRVAAYKPAHAARCGGVFAGVPNVEVCTERTSEIIELAECCLFVSGSVSLELFARRTPGVMVYQASRLKYWVFEKLIVSDSVTLPNLFAGEMLYPEFFPPRADSREVTEIVRTLDSWLSAPASLAAVQARVDAAAARTVKTGAAAAAADAVLRALPAPAGAGASPVVVPFQRQAA